MEDATKKSLIMTFNSTLRSSGLVGAVDFQRAALAFGTLLESTKGNTIDLGPLYVFLTEQGGSDDAVSEVLVFMKSKESHFNVSMTLPKKFAALSPEQTELMVLAINNRMTAASNFDVGTGSNRRPTTQMPPEPPPPPPAAATDFGKQNKSLGRLSPQLKVALGFAVVVGGLGVVNLAYDAANAPPPPQPLVFNDSAGLPCIKFVLAGTTAICRMPLEKFKADSPEAFDARGAITKTFVASKGAQKLLVYTDEDNKLRKLF